jgi:diguanylate cyclase (GGDEF)-like protein
MTSKFFIHVDKNHLKEFQLKRRERNYKRAMFISVFILLVQLMAVISQLLTPFSPNEVIMTRYFLFYFSMISLNIVLVHLNYLLKRFYTIKSKWLDVSMAIHIVVIQVWAMGVAIADQFQNQRIVVYYVSMFFIAFLIEMSIYKLGALLLSTHIMLISILGLLESYLGNSSAIIEAGFQFILFSMIMRYYIDELNKKNFNQKLRLEKANRELEYLSYYDPLSNLYNRRRWEALYHGLYQEAYAKKERLCVLLIDIDYFKQYNDVYGHVEGDQVIRKVSQVLQTCSSYYNAQVGRYGGDEFVIVVNNSTQAQAKELVAMIHASIEALQIEASPFAGVQHLSLSIGFHIDVPNSPDDAWPFVVEADKALYMIKKNRNHLMVK